MEERIIAADPVGDPAGYQRELLALLRGDDPLDVMAATAGEVRRLTSGVDPALLGRAPAAGEWPATQLLGHLFDAQIAYAFRARAILGQDDPELIGYDQEGWAALHHPPFGPMLDAFTVLRDADVALARATTLDRWERAGMHAERGPTTFRLLIETIAGHDRAHLRQLEATLVAVSRDRR